MAHLKPRTPFVIDSSGSMNWNDPQNYRLTAAKSFVDALIQGDRAGVADFDSYGSLYQSLTADFSGVKNQIDRIDASGGTNIGAGVSIANRELINNSSDERVKIEIVLTDGEGSYSPHLTTEAKENNITIYTIGLGSSIDETLLRNIATETGGQYYSVSSAEQLPIYSRILVGGEQIMLTDEQKVQVKGMIENWFKEYQSLNSGRTSGGFLQLLLQR
jgi:Mg-chelatase subunit ChlD